MSTELATQIAELETQVTLLEQEVRVLTGRIVNRDPQKVDALKAENAQLKSAYATAQEALMLLMQASIAAQAGPNGGEDASLQLDIVRQAAMNYFQKTNVDAELWKNLASW